MKKLYTFLMILCILSLGAQGFNSSLVYITINGVEKTYRLPNNNTYGSEYPELQGANLGTFLSGDATKLVLNGFEANVYKCAGQDVKFPIQLQYAVYPASQQNPGSFTTLEAGWVNEFTNGCGGKDQVGRDNSYAEVLLNYDGVNLPGGTYVLDIYLTANTDANPIYLSNNSNNYKAYFTVVDETTWNGSVWDNGTPNTNLKARFSANYNVNSMSAKSISIDAGKIISVNGSLTTGNVENNGQLIINNNANFVQKEDTNTYSGTGSATVYRQAKLQKNDFNYWGSPVSGQNLYAFSEGYNQASPPTNPQGTPWNDFYVYNEATDHFVNTGLDASTTFSPGKGYAIRGK